MTPVYSEPNFYKLKKREWYTSNEKITIYSPYCAKERFISAENVKAIIVSDGLLLLEEKSKVDGIPSDLWVYYKSN